VLHDRPSAKPPQGFGAFAPLQTLPYGFDSFINEYLCFVLIPLQHPANIAKKNNGVTMNFSFDRRRFISGAGAALLAGGLPTLARAQALKVNFADIGVGDPGDWSKFTATSGAGVNLVAIGNAPSAVVNVLLAGGGRSSYDILNIVGGMQRPLVENGLIDPIDTARIPNWSKNSYIQEFFAPGKPGFNFIGYNGKVYGLPTVLQGDSFAYLPEATGVLDSYGALFDPKFKGYVALEDNYTTAGQKTALYLKASKLANIANPDDMSASEFRTVVDFLIEKKRSGQFRTLWSSFEQAVNLIVSKEVHVIDCWEPMVSAAETKGVKAVYAQPKEGYLLWAMAAYIVHNPKRTPEQTKAIYALMDFLLGPWYGAKIALTRNYMTNSQAVPYANTNPAEFKPEEARKIALVDEGVKAKFKRGGVWQNRWPAAVEAYEGEWARFKAAPSR
jgi:spermidine/putrescine-binding protein